MPSLGSRLVTLTLCRHLVSLIHLHLWEILTGPWEIRLHDKAIVLLTHTHTYGSSIILLKAVFRDLLLCYMNDMLYILESYLFHTCEVVKSL